MTETNVVEITPENFQQIIAEQSKQTLILAVFWAEQVPESIELRDKLQVIANQRPDDFILGFVDCQAQQQIAMQFGIQNLPTAILVKDGQPVDGLAGVQTDEAIAEFLGKYLPKEEDKLIGLAQEQLSSGDINSAYSNASSAYKIDNESAAIKLVLADASIQVGKIGEAEALLSTIKMIDQDSHYQSLIAKLDLATQAADSPEIKALEQQIAGDIDNVTLKHQLASQYVQVNRHDDALILLFGLVQQDGGDMESKKLLLEVLKALPDGDPLASKYRRKLYTLLY